MFSEVFCIILVCFNNFLIEKTKISVCVINCILQLVLYLRCNNVTENDMYCRGLNRSCPHRLFQCLVTRVVALLGGCVLLPVDVFLEEVCHLGFSFRFQMHKPGPVSYSFPAA